LRKNSFDKYVTRQTVYWAQHVAISGSQKKEMDLLKNEYLTTKSAGGRQEGKYLYRSIWEYLFDV
jgi:hypothetical protein